MRDHGHADASLPVETGEGVDSVDHAFASAQRSPELVEDHEVVPPGFEPCIRERVRDVDGAEPGGPACEERCSLQVDVGVVDRGDVVDDGCVAPHGVRGVPGEGLAEPTASDEPDERRLEVFRDGFVPAVVAAIERGGAHFRWSRLHDFEKVTEHRHTVVVLIEPFECAVDDGLLAVARRLEAHDREEG